MKTTPWFEAGKQNPVRAGSYRTRGDWFKYWDGKHWGSYEQSAEQAEKRNYCSDYGSAIQSGFYWRGLLKESK
jgi:hypothetical protein